MDISQLEKLETKYSFNYPSLYKQLCTDEMLNTGKYGSNWYKENYHRLKDAPLFLLFARDVELIEEFSLEEHIEELVEKNCFPYDSMRKELFVIPFAMDGGGSLYCLYYNEQVESNIPIIYLPHDSNNFKVMAKNLRDFIFRVLIESCSDFYYTRGSSITEEQREDEKRRVVADFKSMVANHKKYIDANQAKILSDICLKDPMEYSYKSGSYLGNTFGLITVDESNEIIEKELSFDLLNKEFPIHK